MSNTTFNENAMAERFNSATGDPNADIGLDIANALTFLSVYHDTQRLDAEGHNVADLERKAAAARIFIIAVSCHIDTIDPDHVIARRWAALVQEVQS